MLETNLADQMYKSAPENLPGVEPLCSKRVTDQLEPQADTSPVTAPFIYFFDYGMKYGIFKDLGQINKLQEDNKLYSSYIDSWMSYAIKNKVIRIMENGRIEYLDNKPKFYLFKGQQNSIKLESIANTITKLAVKGSVDDPKGLSTCNFYAIKKSPQLTSKYKKIVGDFFESIATLAKESLMSDAAEEVHYVSISTCTLNKEGFNEI